MLTNDTHNEDEADEETGGGDRHDAQSRDHEGLPADKVFQYQDHFWT